MAGAKFKDVVADLRAGLSDDAIIAKYGISASQFQSILQKLVEGRFIKQAELDARADFLCSASIRPVLEGFEMSILETGLTVAQAKDEFLNMEALWKYGLKSMTREFPKGVVGASASVALEAGFKDSRDEVSEDISLEGIALEEEIESSVPSQDKSPEISLAKEIEPRPCFFDIAMLKVATPNEKLSSLFGHTPITEKLNTDCAEIVVCLLEREELNSINTYPEVLVCTTLVELGLKTVLPRPSEKVIPAIIEAQKLHNKKYKTETMEKWVKGQVETSLGILIMLLCGIRWALQQGSAAVTELLQEYFEPGYKDIVLDSRLTKALEIIRIGYRNPAHHATRVHFTRADYETLTNLAIAFTKVRNWLTCTGTPCPPSRGVLHNHLVLKR